MINFAKIPFVRILLPFLLGIISVLYLQFNGTSLFILFTLLFLSSFLVFKKIQSRSIVFPVLLALDILLFFFGTELTKRSQLNRHSNFFVNKITIDHSKPNLYVVQVNDIPLDKPRSVKVDLKIIGIKCDTGYVNAKGNLIGYFQKSKSAKALKPGTVLLVKSDFKEVGGTQNPHAFDFKSYLADKNVYHTSYIDSNSFSVLPMQTSFSLWQFGLSIKYKMLKRLGEVGLSENARSICSALITGFDDDIDKEVLEAFSHSGTLHVLSVSGLHVGLIYLILNYILSLIDRNKKYKIAQFAFITVCLWFFALITGFSAPVLRSVIMFNLFGLGSLFFRNKPANQVNILMFSAFLLLIYHPLWIRDIGFLLSYSALFGIIFFYPKLSAFYEPQNWLSQKIWKSIVVSFSATITTLPITLFVFHQFPLWFALANLIIVPLSFVLLLLAFAALLKLSFVTWTTNVITALMVKFISLFNSESWSFIDRIDFNMVDSLGLSLVLFFFTALCIKRSYAYAMSLMSVIILWQVFALENSYDSKTKTEVVVYQTHDASSFSLKYGIGTVLNCLDSAHYSMSIKPNIVSYNNTEMHVLPFNYVRSDKVKFLTLNKKFKTPREMKGVTHILVSNNSIPDEEFFDRIKPKILIADASNSYWVVRKLERMCEEMQIQFHSTRDKGAFILPL